MATTSLFRLPDIIFQFLDFLYFLGVLIVRIISKQILIENFKIFEDMFANEFYLQKSFTS